MKRRAVLLLACCTIALGGGLLFGDNLTNDRLYLLLVKAARAPMEVAYSGTLVELDTRAGESRRVVLHVEHVPGQGDRVTVLDPALPTRKSERHGAGPAFLIGPGAFRGIARLPFPAFQRELQGDLSLLLANYTLSGKEAESVAGRATYRIEIVPKLPQREEKGLWIDRSTGVVLKVETRLPYNLETRTAYFASIHQQPESWSLTPAELGQLAHALPPPLVVPQTGAFPGVTDPALARALMLVQTQASFRLLSPQFLPTGFVLDEVHRVAIHEEHNRPAVHLLYSDGLSSISLFLQPAEPLWPDQIRRFFFGDPRDRRIHERGFTVLEGTKDGTRYVLVSDIDAGDLAKIAASLIGIAR